MQKFVNGKVLVELTNLLEKIAYKLEKVFEHLRLWARYEGEC